MDDELEITVRLEGPRDAHAVHAVNTAAFAQPDEADLVDVLRVQCPGHLALVAECADRLIGHILFTPCTIDGGDAPVGMGLAPMAVAPAWQRRGIGGRLVNAGLARLRADGRPFVVVLGHAEYYPRFGFVPASRFGLRCTWEVPDEAFMALELHPGVLAPFAGRVVRYHAAFDSVA